MISDKNINHFKKNGFLHLKNFFSEDEIRTISSRSSEIIEEDSVVYKFSLDEIKQLKIKDFIKQRLINYFDNKELKIKNYKQLNEILNLLIPEIKERERLFVTEIIHKKLCKVFGKEDVDILFDLVLSKLIFKEKLNKILKQILRTEKIVYWAESAIQYNKPSVKGWHTDDPINELNNNFRDTFQVRVALYFHSSKSHSGGIKLLPGSHKKIRIFDFFKGLLKGRYKLQDLKNINFNFSKNFYPEPNDILIWDKRLFHSPWASKLKYGINLSLSPKVENIVPNFFLEPPCFPRSLLNFDVGKNSTELSNYLKYWISIRKDYNNKWIAKNRKYKDKINYIKDLGLEFDGTCINDKNIEKFKIINLSHKDLLSKKKDF